MIKYIKIVFILFPLLVNAQTDTTVYLYAFGGNNNDLTEEVQATQDGGYVVIGATSSNSWGNSDAYLLKVDSNCIYQWSKAIGGNNNDWGYSIKQTHDKGYIIAASSNSYGNGGYDACLMKRDSLGNYEWRKIYGSNDWDFAYSVDQTYDSGYVFCGETYNNTSGFSDVYVVRTDKFGDTVWTRTVGSSLIDKGISVIETSDSNIVVAGITNSLIDSTQIYLLKFSATGTLLWDSIYGGQKFETVNQIIEISNNSYVMVGSTTNVSVGGDQDYLIMAVDTAGTQLWIQEYANGPVPTPDDEEAFAIYELANSNLLISGYSKTGGGGKKNVTLFQLTSTGMWANASAVIGNKEDDYIKSVTVGQNGSMLLAGVTNSFGAGMDDVLLMKLDTIYANQDTVKYNYEDMIPLNVQEESTINNFNIYPNPVKNQFKLISDNSLIITNVKIYDLYGREVPVIRLNDFIFDTSKLKRGTYILQVTKNDGRIFSEKIIKL